MKRCDKCNSTYHEVCLYCRCCKLMDRIARLTAALELIAQDGESDADSLRQHAIAALVWESGQ